jgi:malate synthase
LGKVILIKKYNEEMMVSTSVKSIYSVINVRKNVPFHYKQILSCKALKLITDLHLNFNSKRQELLRDSSESTSMVNKTKISFTSSRIKQIKNSELVNEFINRKIEFVKPNQTINLQESIISSASLFIIDFEQADLSSWDTNIQGQMNMKDVVYHQLSTESNEYSDSETLVEKIVPFIVQLRNMKQNEENVLVNKEPVSAAFFNFGLFFYHNAKKLIEQGYSPYFYLPYISNDADAKLWNDIFSFAEEQLGLPKGVTQAVV